MLDEHKSYGGSTCCSTEINSDQGASSDPTSPNYAPRLVPPKHKRANSWPLSPNDLNKQSSFIKNLVAERNILNYITIEPVTFLAVFALFIELPSLQDLVYTKICIDTISTNDFIQTSQGSQIITNQLLYSQTDLPTNFTNHDPSSVVNLPNLNGRIKDIVNKNDNDHDSFTLDDDHYNEMIFLCDKTTKTNFSAHYRNQIESKQQTFWLIFQLTISILCALTAPFWGSISDRVGRLMPIHVALGCTCLANCVHLFAGILISTGHNSFYSLQWLYVPAVIIGLSGGQAVILINSFSFISDITSVESRSKRILVLEIIQNIAHTIAWLLSKYIMGLSLSGELQLIWFNRHFVAFVTCIISYLIGFLYSHLSLKRRRIHMFLNNFEREQLEYAASNETISTNVLDLYKKSPMLRAQSPETRLQPSSTVGIAINVGPNETCNATNTAHAIATNGMSNSVETLEADNVPLCSVLWTLEHYYQTLKTLTKKRDSRTVILLLLLCGFISYTYLSITLSLLYIHLRTEPFNFTTRDYANWMLRVSLLQGLSLIGLSVCMKLVKSWNIPDPLVASLGFLSKCLGLATIGFSQSAQLIHWVPLMLIFSEFTMPPIRSLISKLVVKEELGKIYSCQSALSSFCIVVSNVTFYIAWQSVGQQLFYRICFFGVAILHLSGALVMIYIYTRLRQRSIIV